MELWSSLAKGRSGRAQLRHTAKLLALWSLTITLISFLIDFLTRPTCQTCNFGVASLPSRRMPLVVWQPKVKVWFQSLLGGQLLPRVDVLRGWCQRVQTMLESQDLEGHVAGGEDEDADSAQTWIQRAQWAEQRTPDLPIVLSVLHLLRFPLNKSDSQNQIDEKDGV